MVARDQPLVSNKTTMHLLRGGIGSSERRKRSAEIGQKIFIMKTVSTIAGAYSAKNRSLATSVDWCVKSVIKKGNKMDKTKRQERILQKDRTIKRKLKLAKIGYDRYSGQPWLDVVQPHRLAKKSPYSCGNSNCAMCGNPRKFFGELTIQEQKHLETVDDYLKGDGA